MSAVFLGTLLILLVASKCHAYTFADKAELQTALNAYCANEADATATYGAIGTWDVREPTTLASLCRAVHHSIIHELIATPTPTLLLTSCL